MSLPKGKHIQERFLITIKKKKTVESNRSGEVNGRDETEMQTAHMRLRKM